MDILDPIIEEEGSRLSFFGKGATYFGIFALNLLLLIVTLGIYYPWAKVNVRKYLWNETEFKGSRFVFNGTGIELFRGYVIAYSIFVIFILGMIFLPIPTNILLGFAFIILLNFVLVPFVIFAAWKYRVSRTSWRGIHPTFDGDFKDFTWMYVGYSILTSLTLGIYGSWMRVHLQKYLFSHTRFGGLQFNFKGEGSRLFVINLLGFLLILPTFGIYSLFYLKDRFNFFIDNTTVSDGEYEYFLNSNLDAKKVFEVIIINYLITIFTLGLGFPWAYMRLFKMFVDSIEMPAEIDYEYHAQSSQNYTDATGDSLGDVLDVDFGF